MLIVANYNRTDIVLFNIKMQDLATFFSLPRKIVHNFMSPRYLKLKLSDLKSEASQNTISALLKLHFRTVTNCSPIYTGYMDLSTQNIILINDIKLYDYSPVLSTLLHHKTSSAHFLYTLHVISFIR